VFCIRIAIEFELMIFILFLYSKMMLVGLNQVY
jgi:hypothetical protein